MSEGVALPPSYYRAWKFSLIIAVHVVHDCFTAVQGDFQAVPVWNPKEATLTGTIRSNSYIYSMLRRILVYHVMMEATLYGEVRGLPRVSTVLETFTHRQQKSFNDARIVC